MDPMILASASVIVIGAVAAAVVAIIKQLQAIHHLVNSAALEAAKKLITLEATVAGLHATVASLQSQRVQDAQRAATGPPQVAPPQPAPVAAQVIEQTVGHQVVERQSIKKNPNE